MTKTMLDEASGPQSLHFSDATEATLLRIHGRDVARSMLLDRRMSLEPAAPFCIVVAFDFSEMSDIAMEQALKLASARGGARIDVLTVGAPAGEDVRLQLENKSATINDSTARALMRQHWARASKAGSPEARGLEVAYHVIRGRPGLEIVRFAADASADWIVIGTHGRRGLGRALLGSVAEYVVRHAGCPVIVVRPKAHEPATRERDPLVRGTAIL